MNKRIRPIWRICLGVTLTGLIAVSAMAAGDSSSPYNQSSGDLLNLDRSENIGEYIIEWVLKGASFSAQEDTLFGAISFVLNTVALILASIAISYNGIMYAVHTAQKGVPGGQKIGGFLTTVRSGVAVTMLMPIIANGFSPVQVLVREVVEGSAFLGDQANLLASRFLANEGAVTTPPLTGISDVVWHVALSESCTATFNAYRSMEASDPPYRMEIRKTLDDGVVTWSWDYHRDVTLLPDIDVVAACGSLNITLPSAVAGAAELDSSGELTFSDLSDDQKPFADIAKQQIAALTNLVRTVNETMKGLSAPDLQLVQATGARIAQGETSAAIEDMYRRAATTAASTAAQLPAISLQLAKADLKYMQDIRSLTANAARIVHEQNTVRDQDGSDGRTWVEEAEAKGFAGLGAFYWTQMRITQRIHSIQKHFVEPSAPPLLFGTERDIEETALDDAVLASFVETEFVKTALTRLKAVKDGYFMVREHGGDVDLSFNTTDDVGYGNSGLSGIRQFMNGFATWALNQIVPTILDGDGDLIINFMNVGVVITSFVEISLGLLIGAVILSKFAGAFGVIGSLGKMAIGSTFLPKLGMLVLCGLLVLAAVGGFFQFVLPSIPLIKWIVALQSWAIMMFMAQIFVPLWAMSHASAANDGWMPEHARSGYLLLVELLLRPLLMVFGFFAGQLLMVVANVAIKMALPYLIGLGSEGLFGLVSMFFVMLIVMVMTYRLVVRTFSLVHELPDFLFSRLGMGTSPLGETADGDRHVSSVMGVYSQVRQAPGGGMLMQYGSEAFNTGGGGKGGQSGGSPGGMPFEKASPVAAADGGMDSNGSGSTSTGAGAIGGATASAAISAGGAVGTAANVASRFVKDTV